MTARAEGIAQLEVPMTSSPLIERLEAVEVYEIVHAGKASPRKYRKPINPDGPEAAALIRELVEALEPFAKAADAYEYWSAEAMPTFSYPEQSCDLKFALEDYPNAVGELTESDFLRARTLRTKATSND